jgi:hypothetical protein
MNAIVDSFQTVAAATPVANTMVAEDLWSTTKIITTQFVTLELSHVPGQVRTWDQKTLNRDRSTVTVSLRA